MAGFPLGLDNIHRYPDGAPFMACCRHFYSCETCEDVGLVSYMGPAGVPHTIVCPKCREE
jgi:hypothetical protein